MKSYRGVRRDVGKKISTEGGGKGPISKNDVLKMLYDTLLA